MLSILERKFIYIYGGTMKPDDTIREIFRKGRKELENTEKTKKSLEKAGCNNLDTKTALNLMGCIAFYDKEVFPGKEVSTFYFTHEAGCEILASYHLPEETPGIPMGIYQVRVRGLLADLSNWKVPIMVFDREGRQIAVGRYKATLSQKINMIAIHEVRHRYQLIEKPELLDAYGIYLDPQINSYVRKMREIMERDPGAFYSQYEGEKRLLEFDARAIERLGLGESSNGAREERYRDIIKTDVDIVGFMPRT